MSEEIKETKCNCFCNSKAFKKFVTIALGTFAGVYMALSLFTAIHKPPMPCPCHFGHPMYTQGQFRHHKDFHGKKFHKEFKESKDLKEDGKVNSPNDD